MCDRGRVHLNGYVLLGLVIWLLVLFALLYGGMVSTRGEIA